MRKLVLAAAGVLTLAGGAAQAGAVADPTGDFLASFVGAHDADLDVTSFSVFYEPGAADFLLKATFAGAIDPSRAGIYVVGVDTGTGAIKPFAGIGEPNVVFNQAIVIQKSGAATLGAHALTAAVAGNGFSLVVPAAFLPSTGFAANGYLFNLWPRNGLGNNNQISDFAPENALLNAVPEPATWTLTLVGFALLGMALRRSRAPSTHAA